MRAAQIVKFCLKQLLASMDESRERQAARLIARFQHLRADPPDDSLCTSGRDAEAVRQPMRDRHATSGGEIAAAAAWLVFYLLAIMVPLVSSAIMIASRNG
jgi:hypothetical protein